MCFLLCLSFFSYAIHARDHFTVNVGVGGGLLLLQSIGGGKYSVDELLKKKD
jgi:alanyl-tRNA synthetase